MTSLNKIACVLVVLLSLVYRCASINCFYCNSANNSACTDLKALDEETRMRMIPVVNCETAIQSPVAVNFFCRKIVQTIFHAGHKDSEVRVTRGCGWVRHHRECYKADNSDHLETVCQCFTDHCNSGEMLDSSTNVALFLILTAIWYFVR